MTNICNPRARPSRQPPATGGMGSEAPRKGTVSPMRTSCSNTNSRIIQALLPDFPSTFSHSALLSSLPISLKVTGELLLDLKHWVILSKDAIFEICHKPTTVITYKLHVSTGRRCQSPDCCPPAPSLGRCPRCDRRVWSRPPWSWGWRKTPQCRHRSPLGWVSSGRHPEKQPSVRAGEWVGWPPLLQGLGLVPVPGSGLVADSGSLLQLGASVCIRQNPCDIAWQTGAYQDGCSPNRKGIHHQKFQDLEN